MSFRSSAKTFPHADGTLQSHLNHPVSHLHPIPDHLSFPLAAMAEPLSVVLQATRRSRLIERHHTISNPVRPTVAIFGAGTIGLLAAALVSSRLYPVQATRVVLLDIDAARLDHAAKNGFVKPEDTFLLPMTPRSVMATWSVDQKIQQARQTINPVLEKLCLSQGVDCVYECSGAESCIQMGIFVSSNLIRITRVGDTNSFFLQAAKPGGRILTIGMGSTTITAPLLSAATREVDIIGVFRYSNTYPEAIELLSEDEEIQAKLKSLITHKSVSATLFVYHSLTIFHQIRA
jgi:L-iditol 2-dehydrogenase